MVVVYRVSRIAGRCGARVWEHYKFGVGISARLFLTRLGIGVIAVAIGVAGFWVPVKEKGCIFRPSKTDDTRLLVNKVALEMYSMWAMETGEVCPQNVSELEKYGNSPGLNDAWGNQLLMLCGKGAPREAITGFAVLSLGQDGKVGTDDDIKSWD